MSSMRGPITVFGSSFLHGGDVALISLSVFEAMPLSGSSHTANAIMSPFGVICIFHNSLIQLI